MFGRDFKLDDVLEQLGWAEKWAKETGFLGGTPTISLADFLLLPIFTQFLASGVYDGKKLPNLIKWLKKVRELLPDYSVNKQAMEMAVGFATKNNAKRENPIERFDNTKYIL